MLSIASPQDTMTSNWKKIYLQKSDTTLHDALRRLDYYHAQFLMIVNEQDKLLGVVTDGDIRRALLANHTLDSKIDTVMQKNPKTVGVNISPKDALLIMKSKKITHLPVLDSEGRVVSLWNRRELQDCNILENPVVLMVGGLGSRLGKRTAETPKPMLPIGGKPMLEIILRNCMEWGFRNFFMAVNYKAQIVEKYFGDGSQFGCEIGYLREKKRMGTAGALSLLPKTINGPLLVINGDVLTHINLQSLLLHHENKNALGTMVIRQHTVEIPYGVVNKDSNGNLISLIEKPKHNFFVNAGMYVLSPEVLPYIPQDTFFDMPDLFAVLVREQKKVVTFECQEYWIDVGIETEYVRADLDFTE